MSSFNWQDVFNIRIEGWGLDLHIGIVLAIFLAALFVLGIFARRHAGVWQLTQADFTFAGCASVTLCPTDDVARLAHQAWVEITTRKAALPFDDDHDLVLEVYNSWYELFRSLRELAKNVPTRQGLRKDSDEAQLVEILTGALNIGLRPHLTRWQARFRRWYDEEQKKPECSGLSPQEIQRRFLQYEAMVADLKEVNEGLMGFAEALRKIAHERQRTLWWHVWRQKAPTG